MPKLVVLDESRSDKHPIISVGGFVAELADVPAIERRWRTAKEGLGLDPAAAVKYSQSWEERSHRSALIAAIGELPVAGVVALLEDFRPRTYKMRKETRGDLFIHRSAFEYVLQRLVAPQFCKPGEGPHVVVFDQRDDFQRLSALYAEVHPRGWQFFGRQVPSLASYGYCASLTAAADGPIVEVADLLVSSLTRWAGARCAVERGRTVGELSELEADVSAVASLFPASPSSTPTRRQGYSVIVHTGGRTGNEMLARYVDRWLNDLVVG